MNIVTTEKYDLSYDDDCVVLVDKINDELIIRLFNKDIKKIDVNSDSDLNLYVNSFNLLSKNEIIMRSEIDKRIPSVFINCSDEEVKNIKSNVNINKI